MPSTQYSVVLIPILSGYWILGSRFPSKSRGNPPRELTCPVSPGRTYRVLDSGAWVPEQIPGESSPGAHLPGPDHAGGACRVLDSGAWVPEQIPGESSPGAHLPGPPQGASLQGSVPDPGPAQPGSGSGQRSGSWSAAQPGSGSGQRASSSSRYASTRAPRTGSYPVPAVQASAYRWYPYIKNSLRNNPNSS